MGCSFLLFVCFVFCLSNVRHCVSAKRDFSLAVTVWKLGGGGELGAGQEVGCDETGQELNWLAFVVAMVTIRPPLALHFSGITVQTVGR